ncbi:MAG: sensor histidine kinase [Vicingaceae bacterium]|nr:sensor histidine kinase [Vicingaceae bacterium]
MKNLIFNLFLFTSIVGFSQVNYLDSIAKEMEKVNLEQQIEMALAIPYDKIVASTNVAEIIFLNLVEKKPEIQPKNLAKIYEKLALVNYFLGNYDKRTDYNLKAIKIYEDTGDEVLLGNAYGGLGYSLRTRDLDKALFYMRKAIYLLEKNQDSVGLNPTYDNFGVLQETAGNIDSAIYYYNLALDLKRNQNDSIGIPFALGHLAGAYAIKNDFEKSKAYLEEAYIIRTKRKDVYGIAETSVQFADFYYSQRKYAEAADWFRKSYEKAIANNYVHLAQYASSFLSECLEKTNQPNEAIKYLKISHDLQDSLLNEKSNKAMAQLEIQYETEKKEKLLAEQEVMLTKEQLRVKQRNYTLLGLGLVLVFILVLSYYIYKQQKFKQQKLIEENSLKDELAKITLQNELHEERIRISRDLHDNVGSQLTFIISSVDNMGYLFKTADEKLKERLNSISDFSRTTITQLRDTIWALNKDEISFDDLKSRLYNYIETAKIVKENITFNFEVNVNQKISFNAIEGVNIFRIVQEAINNSLKYSAATTINVLLKESKDKLILKIEDDGIGFNIKEVKLGNGLDNMKNRATSIKAKFHINSTPEKGTTILLEMPIK